MGNFGKSQSSSNLQTQKIPGFFNDPSQSGTTAGSLATILANQMGLTPTYSGDGKAGGTTSTTTQGITGWKNGRPIYGPITTQTPNVITGFGGKLNMPSLGYDPQAVNAMGMPNAVSVGGPGSVGYNSQYSPQLLDAINKYRSAVADPGSYKNTDAQNALLGNTRNLANAESSARGLGAASDAEMASALAPVENQFQQQNIANLGQAAQQEYVAQQGDIANQLQAGSMNLNALGINQALQANTGLQNNQNVIQAAGQNQNALNTANANKLQAALGQAGLNQQQIANLMQLIQGANGTTVAGNNSTSSEFDFGINSPKKNG